MYELQKVFTLLSCAEIDNQLLKRKLLVLYVSCLFYSSSKFAILLLLSFGVGWLYITSFSIPMKWTELSFSILLIYAFHVFLLVSPLDSLQYI